MCGCLLHTPHCGPDLARDPDRYRNWELNRQPFGSQAGAQSTEPHQPGQQPKLFTYINSLKLHVDATSAIINYSLSQIRELRPSEAIWHCA